MKLNKVKYQKCFNLGNFENEVIGVEIEVEDGETREEVLAAAKRFVEAKGDPLREYKSLKARYENILNNKTTNLHGAVLEAEKWLCNDNNKINENNLPF